MAAIARKYLRLATTTASGDERFDFHGRAMAMTSMDDVGERISRRDELMDMCCGAQLY